VEVALSRRVRELGERARFIEAVVSNDIDLTSGALTGEMVAQRLDELGFGQDLDDGEGDEGDGADGAHDEGSYDALEAGEGAAVMDVDDFDIDIEGEESVVAASSSSSSYHVGKRRRKLFDALLSLPLRSFTAEKIEATRREVAKEGAALEALRMETAAGLWLRDLARLEEALRSSSSSSSSSASSESSRPDFGHGFDDGDGDDGHGDMGGSGAGDPYGNIHTGLMQLEK
jgi:hypothetical protein